MHIVYAIVLFVIAGICEIAGGYLVWLWVKEERHWWLAVAGGALLVVYGVVATFQAASFGRAYAAYGGVFIAMSIYWGWKIDGVVPDRYDLIGGFICLIGVFLIMFGPRN